MTLTATTVRLSFSGDDSTTSFAVSFIFWDADDLQVILRDASNVETTWVRGADYTVTGGSGSTGTVEATTPPATGETLVVISNVPDTQETSFPLGGPFSSAAVEQEFDKTVRRIQQKVDALSRRLGITDADSFGTGGNLEIPILATRKGGALAFNSTTGDPEVVALSGTGSLPHPSTLTGLNMIRVNSGKTAYEERTPAQVRADLGGIVQDLDTLGAPTTDGEFIVATGAGAFAYETGATLRTSIGVGTGDSPQFTGIELGHASDTTLTRSGAGDVDIEGNAIYRAGGTDVPVADGGTGASTLTDGGVLLGSGTDAITAMAVLADGEMIVGDGTTDPVAESGATLRTSIGVGTGDVPDFAGLQIGAKKVQQFVVRIVNSSGTLQHQIIEEQAGAAASGFADKITGASATLANTPSVGAGTDFTSGGGIRAAATQQFILDTANIPSGEFFALCAMQFNSTGNDFLPRTQFTNINVNGTTIRRLTFEMYDATAGTNILINTTNIASGKSIAFNVWAILP